MFTTPTPAAPTVSTTTTVAPSSTSQPRPSIFASLRNYTHSLSATPPGASRAHARAPRDQASQTAKSGHRPRASTTTPPISPSFTTPTSSAAEQSRLSRTLAVPDPPDSSIEPNHIPVPTMTRTRAETAAPQLTVRNQSGPTPAATPPVPTMEGPDHAESSNGALKHLPSIRLIPHQDPRAGRPSLQFPTISRTLPDENAVIRVGRYSERDNIPEIPANVPSSTPVGFKSKVVSRKHCELWCKDSQWYIKDVKSSSGTFLNHIRLSQPNVESKPFKLKDGDIIQLGIDFRGGEEMIFRCVKIRIECNRGWQQALNTFNKQTHQRLRNLAKNKESDAASAHASECSICLMSIAPCQSLFVAPCSHVWHYKCIRPILNGPTWPNFLCPNCRAVTDLEADVEDPGDFEEWDDEVAAANDEGQANGTCPQEDRHVTPRASGIPLNASDSAQINGQISFADLEAAISNISIGDSLNGIANQTAPAQTTPQRLISPAQSSSVTQPVSINMTSNNERSGLSPILHTTVDGLTPERTHDCPMTPRNDAGPFVLDGSAGRGPST